MSKSNNVVLSNKNEKVGDLTLEINHAERLLLMPRNGGWELPENSPYKLDKNGIVRKSSKGAVKKSKEQGKDQ